MQAFRVIINLQSAFATPLKGDTLFGQLCWAIRNRQGEDRLAGLLNGYTSGQPFALVSDAFPEGYLPLPRLPSHYYRAIAGEDRKAVKKRSWLPTTAVDRPVEEWLENAITPAAIASDYNSGLNSLTEKHPQPHNTINRLSNTTGKDGFAPYNIEQEWFIPGLRWEVYVLLETEQLTAEDCHECLNNIGAIGFGRDASIGLGKFSIDEFKPVTLPAQTDANACVTLAPCAPQGLGFDGQNSFYQLFTRFGRHGDIAVHKESKPFKNPVLMAQTAAVFGAPPPVNAYLGQGIGGNGELSKALAETVHQGYAPVIAINLKSKGCL